MRQILSIDGGGIKGVFPASFLAAIESVLGDEVVKYFDLIAGTSTGGIIALGLGLGFPAAQILELYEHLGPKVFTNSGIRGLLRLGFSKYDAKPLRETLEVQFGDKRLGDSQARLVIPTLNLETGEVHIYKTSHHPRFEMDFRERAVDVALATAAAPTYFPTHRTALGIPLVDGGTWANNPIGVAVVEAIGVLGWSADFIRVLSLGCTTTPLDVKHGRDMRLGVGYWAFKFTDVFMSGQSSAALGTAQVLIGHDDVYRISPSVAHGRFSLDGIREIDSLKGLGATEARKHIPMLRERFFTSHAEPFAQFHK